MNLQALITLLALALTSSCGAEDTQLTDTSPTAEETDVTRLGLGHYEARNCEIFIDKVTPYASAHALRAVNLWVKVLPSRLDGAVAEVGFRNAQEGRNWSGPTQRDWANDVLRPFFGASDYFEFNTTLSSDFGSNTYRGAFYVKTDKGTTYWAKASTGGDFVFDTRTHDIVASLRRGGSYDGSINGAVDTQRAGMEYYNVNRCR